MWKYNSLKFEENPFMKSFGISLIRGKNETSGRQNCYLFFQELIILFFCYRNVTSNTEMLTDLRFIGGRFVTSFIWWRHSYDDVTHLLKVNFFVICLSPEFLPVSGPLTHLAQPWCVALGRALDSGLISRWVWGLCQLGSSSMPGWTSQITYYYIQVTGL